MSQSLTSPIEVLRLFGRYPLRWIVPAVLTAAALAGYAVLKSDTWEAVLPMVVRAEASGNAEGAGRFRTLSEMKTLEETLVEIVKSRAVLQAALVQVGPPAEAVDPAAWPSPQDVDDLSDALKVVPPKGAELGATEMFYLKVRAKSPERAVALADAVADRMLAQFQQVRDDKVCSIVTELEKAVAVARKERDTSVRALGEYEGRVGGDIAELRNLEQLGSGDGDVRKMTVELENEARQADQALRNIHELKSLLLAAKQDPSRLVATPNRLLEQQPALRRLKDGLIDAQLRSSTLRGSMSPEHPLVRASVEGEKEVRQHLYTELSAALSGLEAEESLAESLLTDRRRRLDETKDRLNRLASLRAEYSALFAENVQRSKQLETAEKQLADARATQAGNTATSLVTRINKPDAGSKPVGPGRTLLILIGVAGGLLVGAGCLLLTTAPEWHVPASRPHASTGSGQRPHAADANLASDESVAVSAA